MAGDWIPYDHDLPDKEEVLALAASKDLVFTDAEARLGVVLLRLCRLWIWGDRHTEGGVLRDICHGGVALKCGGDEAFWRKVDKLGWLAVNGEGVVIPKFEQRFGTSARSRLLACKRKRRERERKNAEDEPKTERDNVTGSVTETGHERDRSRQPQPQPQPVSEPLSQPEPETTLGSASAEPCRTKPDPPKPRKPRTPTADIDAVVTHYQTFHDRARPGAKERHLVALRLQDGYSVEDLCHAIDGCHVTPHNLGANERDTPYLSLELILRNSSQVTRFLENAAHPPKPRNEKERRTLDAAAAWIERVSG